MLHLGDISNKNGNQVEAVDLWETARPLFKRSSQANQVEGVTKRLTSVGNDVLEQHQKNLARLTELNAPSRKVEELLGVEDDLSDIEELKDGDLDVVKWDVV
jgi:translation initiation factor 6 (eIF-6)